MANRKTKAEKDLEQLAQETLDGKWGSGRDRDTALRDAGHNPAEVQTARARLRSESATEGEAEADAE